METHTHTHRTGSGWQREESETWDWLGWVPGGRGQCGGSAPPHRTSVARLHVVAEAAVDAVDPCAAETRRGGRCRKVGENGNTQHRS